MTGGVRPTTTPPPLAAGARTAPTRDASIDVPRKAGTKGRVAIGDPDGNSPPGDGGTTANRRTPGAATSAVGKTVSAENFEGGARTGGRIVDAARTREGAARTATVGLARPEIGAAGTARNRADDRTGIVTEADRRTGSVEDAGRFRSAKPEDPGKVAAKTTPPKTPSGCAPEPGSARWTSSR